MQGSVEYNCTPTWASPQGLEEQIARLGEQIRRLSEQQQLARSRLISTHGLPGQFDAVNNPACCPSTLSRRLIGLQSETVNAQHRNFALGKFCDDWKQWVHENMQQGSSTVASRRRSYLEAVESMLPLWSEVNNQERSAAATLARMQLEALKQHKQDVAHHLEQSQLLRHEMLQLQSDFQTQNRDLPLLYHALAQEALRPTPQMPEPSLSLEKQTLLEDMAVVLPPMGRETCYRTLGQTKRTTWGTAESLQHQSIAGCAMPDFRKQQKQQQQQQYQIGAENLAHGQEHLIGGT